MKLFLFLTFIFIGAVSATSSDSQTIKSDYNQILATFAGNITTIQNNLLKSISDGSVIFYKTVSTVRTYFTNRFANLGNSGARFAQNITSELDQIVATINSLILREKLIEDITSFTNTEKLQYLKPISASINQVAQSAVSNNKVIGCWNTYKTDLRSLFAIFISTLQGFIKDDLSEAAESTKSERDDFVGYTNDLDEFIQENFKSNVRQITQFFRDNLDTVVENINTYETQIEDVINNLFANIRSDVNDASNYATSDFKKLRKAYQACLGLPVSSESTNED